MTETDIQKRISTELTNIEFVPEVNTDIIHSKSTISIPIASISSLGAAFSSILPPLRTVTQTITSNGGEQLFRMIMPNDVTGTLAMAKGKLGTYGNIINDASTIVGRARFVPTENVSQVETTMPFDPATMLMAGAVMSIEHKLVQIQKIQQNMIDFMELKEMSEIRGNLTTLTDIINNYKFNWNNEQYKNNKHILIQEIKRDTDNKIIFYSERIKKELDKHSPIHSEKQVKDKLKEMLSNFKEYNLAVYLYSFSSFLEVMLLGNFDAGFLEGISNKIESYSLAYRELYTRCYNQIDDYSKSSIESFLLKGLSKASKVAGEAVAKNKFIGTTQLDENLLKASEKLSEFKDKIIDTNTSQFIGNNSNYVRPFIDSIETISKLYNQPTAFLCDKENIYIEIA